MTSGDESALTYVENPTHLYSEESAQNYTVTLVLLSLFGCNDTTYATTQVIQELIYYVPNTFTPDGDAFINTFKPVFTSEFANRNVRFFCELIIAIMEFCLLRSVSGPRNIVFS